MYLYFDHLALTSTEGFTNPVSGLHKIFPLFSSQIVVVCKLVCKHLSNFGSCP